MTSSCRDHHHLPHVGDGEDDLGDGDAKDGAGVGDGEARVSDDPGVRHTVIHQEHELSSR